MIEAVLRRFLYHPVSAAESWESPPPGLQVEDVELQAEDGTRLHAWWSPPPGWQPAHGAVVYCHGNAGNLSHRGEGLRRWQDLLGLAVLIFDYPGYGRSGGKPSESGCYAAGDVAYRWLTGVARVPAGRVVLYGGSLGGAVAVELARRHPHHALVLVSAFSSLADMARLVFPRMPAGWLVRGRFDNVRKIAGFRGPVFIAHGTADRLVPFAQGEHLFAAAPGPKQFFPMPGYDHNHTPGLDFYDALRRFLAEAPAPGPVLSG